MGSKELCFTCKPNGECAFKKDVDLIINALPPLDKQTEIKTNDDRPIKPTVEAIWTHTKIMFLRAYMRNVLNCPNVNYDPEYPGRNTL